MNAPGHTAERVAPIAGATASFVVSGPDHLAEPVLELLPIRAIAPSETHIQTARRDRYSAEALVELAKSIKSVGVLQPIVVRPLSAMRGLAKFELVAGERRWLAADRAGLAHIPASVRDLSDAQVIEVQLVENLQREDLHEMEEAEGYRELMDLKHITADEVGVLIGKSRSYVYARLKLLALAEPAREAFARGELDSSRALIVARIQPEKLQAKALLLAVEKDYRGERWTHSVRSLKKQLDRKRMTISLKTAPFPLDAEFLVDDAKLIRKIQPFGGACQACPQRSGNATDQAATADDPDVCTHVDCYDLRVRLAEGRRIDAAVRAGAEVITDYEAKKILSGKDHIVGYVDLNAVCEDDEFPEPEPENMSDKDGDAYEAWDKRQEEWEKRSEAWQRRTYRQLLADESLDVALVLDPRTRAVRELVPIKQARAKLKERGVDLDPHVGAPVSKSRPAYDYKAEQAKADAKRKADEERCAKELAWRRAVIAELWPRVKGQSTRADLVALAEQALDRWEVKEGAKRVLGAAAKPGTMKDADLQRLLMLLPVAASLSNAWHKAEPLLALAKRFKVDAAKVKREVEAKEKGEAAAPAKKVPAKKKTTGKK